MKVTFKSVFNKLTSNFLYDVYTISILTELSKPSVNNIIKKIKAQKIDPGIVAIAAGYTTKTRPGPSVATSAIGFPVICDI